MNNDMNGDNQKKEMVVVGDVLSSSSFKVA